MSVPQKRSKRKRLRVAISAAMPSSVDPMLPTPVKLRFSDPQWFVEPKWDGYRALCFLKDGKVRFISRNRRNLTQRFPELQEISTLIKAETAIIDGEIVALDRSGKPTFDALRYRQHHGAIVFYAFDLLYFDGQDISQYPLVAGKAAQAHPAQSIYRTNPIYRAHRGARRTAFYSTRSHPTRGYGL